MRLAELGNGIASSLGGPVLAICVPAKEKKRNKKVPTNSPKAATMLFRVVEGLASMGSPDWAPCPFGPGSELKESKRCLQGVLMLAFEIQCCVWEGFG